MSAPSIFEVLQQFSANIPGCILTSVVDADSGMSFASVTPDPNVGAAAVDAYHSDLYRLLQRSMQMLEAPQLIESVVLVGDEAIFMSVPIPNSTYFWQVVTDLNTTVGFTQALMRKFQPTLHQSMAQVFGE